MKINVTMRSVYTIYCLVLTFSYLNAQQTRNTLFKEVKRTITVDYKYLMHLPDNPELMVNGRLPLIVFLHGAGERGSDFEKIKVHGPPEIVERQNKFPFAVLSPQCKEGESWDPVTLDLLLDEVIGQYPIDTGRIYLTGLSMGGRGTWDWAFYRPGRFAAIAPICGWGEPFRAHQLKDLPVWVYHGALDNVVPLQESSDMVNALRTSGNKYVKFTIYPDAGHDAWTDTYNDASLYEWFLQYAKR